MAETQFHGVTHQFGIHSKSLSPRETKDWVVMLCGCRFGLGAEGRLNVNIIYVDDEQDLVDVFRENLESPSLKIFTFTSPFEVLEMYEKINPDLIITDYRMPLMSGVELLKRLPASLPKIILTADFSVKTDDPLVQVLHKPANYDAIQLCISQLPKVQKIC